MSEQPSKRGAPPPPPGNTGTHWTGPNTYLLSQLQRANYLTSRRNPVVETSDALCAALQRLVHHEGNRPPNRKILLHLRLLTYYPPNAVILPELVELIESDNVHVCRLAHYHLRQAAPIDDPAVYRDLIEALEREVVRVSPARRAAATKTLAKVFLPHDAARATDFVVDVFNCIGGARVKSVETVAPRKVAGIEIPGTDKNKKKNDKRAKESGRFGQLGQNLFSKSVIVGEVQDKKPEKKEKEVEREVVDDGAGGSMVSERGTAEFIKSRFGKMLVGHCVFAALRRINRIATKTARIESYLFDSGLLSVVPSTVRHCIALLELRSTVAPTAVSKYLVQRLPHRNPPANKRLHLEELGARVYFARMLSALAEDPNLSAFIPDEAPKKKKREGGGGGGGLRQVLGEGTVKTKASNLFRFLFNKERVSQVVGAVKASTSGISNEGRATLLKRDDPLGVEFAEALVNLLKNASNRVLIEALRGLSRRKWTTWFEAPIPQGALYNSPELMDAEAYGGAADAWGLDDDDEEDEEDDEEDENELGAYENDVADDPDESKASVNQEIEDPALDDLNVSGEKETWFSRLKTQRKERRLERVDKATPFYLRKVGQGMVPALEVILRRIYAALLHDEPVRRFSAADAIIVLARAKIYGHSQPEHDRLRKAQSNVRNKLESSSRALVPVGEAGAIIASGGAAFNEEKHPFQALVRPLAELLEEDPNQYVRGRAAVALLFVIAAGAGREMLEADDLDIRVSEEALARSASMLKIPLLVRYFRNFVTHRIAGSGVGLRLMSEVIDYLVYEVLDVAPDLASSAVEMAELWAQTHPTVGVCGRLGALWEKVLSIGQGEVVGKSIFRAVASKPRAERVASAAVIFLRRRTLDLAIITVGSSNIAGIAVPEPLPRAIGVEMEKYFSLLWHAALLGPSAECRIFAVEALGGAAVLAGEPFRCCTYERLVELVRMRGFGLKIPAEQVLNCLDVLYFSRERFSEARAKNRIARDGTNTSKQWLQLVWQLAAEASSAAQILLGVPPPTGWQPLGPSGAGDLGNAEGRFGDVRDRQDNVKLKDASVAQSSAPGEAPLLALEAGESSTDASGRKVGSGGMGEVPPNASMIAYASRYPQDGRRSRSRERSDGYGRGSGGRYVDDVDEYDSYSPPRNVGNGRRRSRSGSPGTFQLPRSRSDLRDSLDEERPLGNRSKSERVDGGKSEKQRQEDADFALALKLQEEDEASSGRRDNGGRDVLGDASDAAGKLLSKGMKAGSRLTSKAVKAAAKSGATDRLKKVGSSSRRY